MTGKINLDDAIPAPRKGDMGKDPGPKVTPTKGLRGGRKLKQKTKDAAPNAPVKRRKKGAAKLKPIDVRSLATRLDAIELYLSQTLGFGK